jgi:molybdate/tungstate transport system substrate-binding protein
MPDHVDFNIQFATNELAIAYTDRSLSHEKINAENWTEILIDEKVVFGRSDPNIDPCGYRTLMAFQLAEKYYNEKGLADKLSNKFGGRFIRPKETDLLALLESGQIDYLFIYRSVAVQHGLKIITLPDQINLKSKEFADIYKTAKVEVSGKQPGQKIIRTGEPMLYSVTVPKNSPNPELAAKWIELLLSPQGVSIMENNGQPCVVPPNIELPNNLPEPLKSFNKDR